MSFAESGDSRSFPVQLRLWTLAVAIVYPSLLTWVYFVLVADAPSWVQYGVYAPGKLLQFVLPIAFVLLVERRMPKWRRPIAAELVWGGAFGLLTIAAAVALYALWLKPAGHLDPMLQPVLAKVQGLGLASGLGFLVMGGFYALLHSLAEEYYWRWFVFTELEKVSALPWAIGISSAGFTAHHVILLGTFFHWNPLPTVLFSLCVGAGGVVWAALYHRFGSLWGVWLSHLLVDAAIFAIGFDLVRTLL